MGTAFSKNTTSDAAMYWPLLLLTLSGLSFLFFLGFPFANHNESYWWIIILDKISFIDALTTRLEPVQSFRPLGTATAWLTYKIAGNIYMQQLVNWLFACLSFVVLFQYAKNKLFFSAATLIATAGFFAGYIYLFHLHGVFYGPLQLYIAILTCLAYTHRNLTSKKLFILFLITIVAALYHTFALLVFAGFIAGCVLQVPQEQRRTQFPLLFGFLIVSLLFIYIIIRLHPNKADGDAIQGTLSSFTTTEINLPLSLLAALFTLLTVFTMPVIKKLKQVFAIVALVLSFSFIFFNLPVLLLWILVCILKMIFSKNWAMASLVFATAVFPVATHTGTPTYIVFVIMVCVFIMSMDNSFFKSHARFITKAAPAFVCFLLLVLLVAKAGIKIPGITNGLNPVLAEQEKTRQLETILAWKKSAMPYEEYSLRFLDESSKPATSKNVLNRKNRPPTQQGYLNRYCKATMPAPISDTLHNSLLFITFGGKMLNDRKKVFEVRGQWNGAAYVYQ